MKGMLKWSAACHKDKAQQYRTLYDLFVHTSTYFSIWKYRFRNQMDARTHMVYVRWTGRSKTCSTVIPNVNLWTVRYDSLRNTSFGIMRCPLYFKSESAFTEAWMALTTASGQAVTIKVVLAPNFHMSNSHFILQDIKQRRWNVLSSLPQPQGLK